METQHFTFLEKEFTLREMQVISLNSLALTKPQIGGYLNCASGTVKSHLRNVRTKLGYVKKDNNNKRLLLDSVSNGFDSKGNYNGKYLFADYPNEGFPWH